MEPITFVTPSFARDYERFVFQRESMARCGIDVPHVVIVHDEEVDLFKRTPYCDGLTVLSTRDVLPPAIEGLRQAGRIPGWGVQQLTKLAAADVVDTDYVCVDSDTFWVRPVDERDFRAPDGQLRLFERHSFSTFHVQWLAESLAVWNVAPEESIEPVSCVDPIVPMARSLVRDLRRDLEVLQRVPWYRIPLERGVVEYSIYGVYARYVRRLDGVVPTEPNLVVRYWESEFELFRAMAETIAAEDEKKAVMVHCNPGVSPDDYRATVEQVWRAING
jgi:hypothetical protein